MERGALVHKRFSNASAAVVIAASISACSSSLGATPPQPGTLPAGTAQVTINDQALPMTHAVTCMPAGSLTTITIGDTAAGTNALVSNEKAQPNCLRPEIMTYALTPRQVSRSDLGTNDADACSIPEGGPAAGTRPSESRAAS